jgi:clan AA aspartic protease
MGMVRTEIILKNVYDEKKVDEGSIKPEAVRSVTVTAVADTGAMYLVINEELREKLGLSVIEKRMANTANGQRVQCNMTEPVFVYWKERRTSCSAAVIPGAKYILLGAIPLEGMDLMVNPVTQELEGAHGDEVVFPLLYYTMEH